MDLSFPTKEHLTEDQYSELLSAARLINKNHFTEGLAALNTLKETLTEAADVIPRCIISHRINSANYQRGEYLLAYTGSETILKELQALIKDVETKSEDVSYWLMKVQTFVAKCLNKIKDTSKAEEVCDDILAFIRETEDKEEEQVQQVVVHKYDKFGVKALYMKAKNMMNIMEFKKAKDLLEDEAKPMLKALIKQYQIKAVVAAPVEEKVEAVAAVADEVIDKSEEVARKIEDIIEKIEEEIKHKQEEEREENSPEQQDLLDNRYSFEFRKKYALYLKKFAFYDQSAEILV